MTTRPYELLARFSADGQTVVGVSVKSITTQNGKDYEGDPEPLAGTDDPIFAAFAAQFAAAVVVERDSLKADLDALAGLQSERDSLAEQVTTLQTEIEQLKNPPKPTQVAPAQLRVWLIQNIGLTVLDQIAGMLEAIPDPAQRAIAKIKWEYGITVLRNDPLVVQFGQALGFNDAQLDAAFVEASKL